MDANTRPDFDYAGCWASVAERFESESCPPALRYWAHTELPPNATRRAFPFASVAAQPALLELSSAQREDGSFGDGAHAASRILPSLWALRSMTDLGASTQHAGYLRCARFLCAQALHEGGFAFDGRREGVLSCYTSLFALLLARGRLPPGAEAAPDLDAALDASLAWLERYQAVTLRGADLRSSEAARWEDGYLTHRYGGCFAHTSCLTGVVRCGHALHTAAKRSALIPSLREYLLERRLFQTGSGGVIPLWGKRGDAKRAAQWLRITYPHYYHVDLVHTVQFVAESGPYDARMRPAIELLLEAQLEEDAPKGGEGLWPLQHKTRREFVHTPERVNQRKGSLWATYLVLRALKPIYHAKGASDCASTTP